jgi:hypothetical protein
MFMKFRVRCSVMAVMGLILVVASVSALAAEPYTTGEFVKRFAEARNLDATDPGIAATSLRNVGVDLPQDINLDARLTESDVVKISRAAGLRVTSSNPNRLFTREQAESYFFAFSDELLAADGAFDDVDQRTVRPYGEGNGNGWGPPFDPFTKGKGKAKGHGKGWNSPTDPE